MTLPALCPMGMTKYAKISHFHKYSLIPHMWKRMHNYDIHEAKIVTFMTTGSKVQTLQVGIVIRP